MQTFFIIVLTLLSLFMILLILIQRGKGGGLAGAFGGMGGQSAFGTKAGDTFTRITVVTAVLWFLLCTATVYNLGNGSGGRGYTSKFGSGQPTTDSADAPAANEATENTTAPTPPPATTVPAPTTEPVAVP